MNKTYIANENHPYLKTGVEVDEEGQVLDWTGLYMVKPNSQPDWYDEVKWKPEVGEKYFYLGSDGSFLIMSCEGAYIDKRLYEIGNCYKTREEAEQARERVLKAYKGE